jgi:hypothetical protein
MGLRSSAPNVCAVIHVKHRLVDVVSVVGCGLACAAGRWLAVSSFGIRDASGVVVIAIAATLALVSGLGSWWPGRQVGRIPALEAMSVE